MVLLEPKESIPTLKMFLAAFKSLPISNPQILHLYIKILLVITIPEGFKMSILFMFDYAILIIFTSA
jgi:hypothetical protein